MKVGTVSMNVAHRPRKIRGGDSKQTPEPPHPNPPPSGAREPAPFGERASDTSLESAALYRLMTWLSPAYPVGAFSYSGGLEWAIDAGDITDTATLANWLGVMMHEGGGFCDGCDEIKFTKSFSSPKKFNQPRFHSI